LSDWIDADCPRSPGKIGAGLIGLSYSRSRLIAWLHRLGFDYRKPQAMPRGLGDAKQQAFIDETRTCSTRWAMMRRSFSSMRFIRPIRSGRPAAGLARASRSPWRRAATGRTSTAPEGHRIGTEIHNFVELFQEAEISFCDVHAQHPIFVD
jgi:hypothetical protein